MSVAPTQASAAAPSPDGIPATGVRLNIAANLTGRAWVTLLGLAFIPIYLRFLGPEAYGLVGFFAVLQGVLGILDMGLGATINRELARFSAGEGRRGDQRTMLRTLEICHWGVALLAGLMVWVLAPAIAGHWLHAAELPASGIERAIRLMGLVLALQLPASFYQAALMGLQRQVLLNALTVATATLRSAGTAFVLWQISPTIHAFFICQAIAALLQLALTLGAVWVTLGGGWSTRPEPVRVLGVWRYAAATSANAIIGIALTQLDKVLLSRLLGLEHFAYYVIAGTAASFVWAVAIPINQAMFPRFVQLVERGDPRLQAALYHRASQLMAVALVPASATVVVFSWPLMLLWTRDRVVADQTALILSLLVAGTTINGLVSVPAYFQAAAGWPSLMAYTNLVGAVILVPAVLVMTPRFGAPGAAAVWLVLNAGYLIFHVPLMHRRLLAGELWRWYTTDLLRPGAAAVAVALAGRVLVPVDSLLWVSALGIGLVWALATVAAAAASPVAFERLRALFAPAGATVGG